VRIIDLLQFTLQSLYKHGFRTAMMLLAMSIGVASVVVLTGLGEGARAYVLSQFSFLGTDTLLVLPGKKETTGGMPPITGSAARDITIEDAQTLQRLVRGVKSVVPLVIGSAPLSHGSRIRETLVLGATRDFFDVLELQLATGQPLPLIPFNQAKGTAVIGQTVRKELFGGGKVIGQWLRIGEWRFRVIGVISGRGDTFGMDLSDSVIIPVASAQSLFNTQALFRLFIKIKPNASMDRVEQQVTKMMAQLHQGDEDVTLIRPDSLLSTFNDILRMLTLAIAGIAGISLVVAGILIMNITLISVNQRTREIGLLKAIGASAQQIRTIFLVEASTLALLGSILGIILGDLLLFLARSLYPQIAFVAPSWAIASAIGLAIGTGMLFAYIPANRAAQLEPVQALSSG